MPFADHNAFAVHQATAEFNRTEEMDGRKYLVAPVVAVREGVLNGELAPAEEISRYVDAWNGIPLVIGHPSERGIPISANRPNVLENRGVGRFWNAKIQNDRLMGEIWLDVAKCKTLGGLAQECLERMENGEPLEVSTAYYRDLEETTGEHDGESYQGIQRNLRPDHLALLVEEEGACNWEDGCGAPRINEGGEDGVTFGEQVRQTVHRLAQVLGISTAELSDVDRRGIIEDGLHELVGGDNRAWVEEIYDDYFVYRRDDSWFRRDYEMNDDGEVDIAAERQEVNRQTNWVPVENVDGEDEDDQQPQETDESNSEGGRTDVEKCTLIDNLINNDSTRWTEEDRETLSAFDEDALEKMDPVEAEGETNDPEPAPEQEDGGEEEETTSETPSFTMDDLLNALPEGEREALSEALSAQQDQKSQIVKLLANNEQCAFDTEELQEFSMDKLRKLAKSLREPDYSGVGGPRYHEEDENEVPAPPPVVLRDRTREGKE